MVLILLSLNDHFWSKYAVWLCNVNMYSLLSIQKSEINSEYFL